MPLLESGPRLAQHLFGGLLAHELENLARGRGDAESEARLKGVADEAEQEMAVVQNTLLKADP
jgi:hypothetical protein